jgi:Hint module
MLVPGVAYTFEIFDTEGDGICCRYGNGNFNVYAEIGGTDVLLVEGYARFGYSDLFVFSVPANPSSSSTVAPARAPVIAPISAVTGPPTKAPIVITSSPASLPTGSPPTASTGKVSVRVDITTDEYPEETSWSIKLGNTVIFEQPAGSLTPWNSLVSERVVLVPGVSYTFEISDTEGDGICCRYGNGNFIVYAEIGGKSVRLLGGNGRFGDSSLFVFSVSTDPSSSTTIAPTRAPVPTGSPPTATSTGKVSVRVDIMTDDYPEETSWSIKQGNTVIFEQPAESLTSWNSLVSERVMLVAGATYTFEISDTEGDGICCRYGNGNFIVYAEIDGKDVRLVGGNGGFASSVQIVFTVPASTTLATIAPVTAPSKAPTRAPSGGFCFSGEATVQVKDMGTMPMKKLKIGDRVLTASGNYDAVYSFGHRHESVEATFLQFVPSGLEISKDHMLLVGGKFIPASSVKIGDHLESASGDVIHVEAIRSVVRNGVYAPFTTSGTIVVSNVKASNYIAFQDSGRLIVSGWETPVSFQWIAHMSQSPHRIYSHYLGWSKTEEYTEDGRSTWISGLYELSLWLLNQNGAVMTVMLIPAAGLGMLSMAAESIISWFV